MMSCRILPVMLVILIKASFINAQASLSKAIYFRPGQCQLDSAQCRSIDAFLKPFGGQQPGSLKIVAYADTIGTEMYNDSLSARRASAVYSYIRSRMHIHEKRAYVTSLGESSDVYDLHFPAAHARQRCVDIWFEK